MQNRARNRLAWSILITFDRFMSVFIVPYALLYSKKSHFLVIFALAVQGRII